MDTDHSEMLADVRRGMIPAHIYNDAEVFALEKERLFSRSWMFVAHESEVPAPGDYVVRHVLEDSFIIVRDEDGQVRALFNMCLHRGMQVCRAEIGNASHFRCPYHGWSYRNDGRLVGLPFHRDAYGGEAGYARKDQTLLPAPAMDIYNGMIFVSLDPDVEPLKEFLGDFAFYLDYYTRQSQAASSCADPSAGGSRPTGRSAPRTSPATCTTRRTPTRASSRSACSANPGPRSARTEHLLGRQRRRDDVQAAAGRLRREARLRRLPRRDGRADGRAVVPGATRVIGADGFMISAATVFPNLSFVHNWPRVGRVRRRAAVHLAPPVAAGLPGRDRGALVVRRRQGGPGGASRSSPTRPT